MQSAVREHLIRLVGKDRLLTPLVIRAQAIAFAAAWNIDNGESCGPCCTADDFRFDIEGPAHSPWNMSACRVFCADYIEHHKLPSTANIMKDIEHSFYTRLKTLRRKYVLHLLQQDRQAAVARKNRRYQRKSRVRSSLSRSSTCSC